MILGAIIGTVLGGLIAGGTARYAYHAGWLKGLGEGYSNAMTANRNTPRPPSTT